MEQSRKPRNEGCCGVTTASIRYCQDRTGGIGRHRLTVGIQLILLQFLRARQKLQVIRILGDGKASTGNLKTTRRMLWQVLHDSKEMLDRPGIGDRPGAQSSRVLTPRLLARHLQGGWLLWCWWQDSDR